MKKTLPYTGAVKRGILIVALIGASSTELLAQGTSPWLQAIDVLQQAFTGPIARGLSLIAIVVGGLMFAFGEGGSKKALAGIVFGLGMAMMNIIRGLIPKRELYLRRTDAAGILRLEVDPASYWLYTSSPVDAAKRAAAVKEHGLEQALEHLSKRR